MHQEASGGDFIALLTHAIANYNDNAPSNNDRWYIGSVTLSLVELAAIYPQGSEDGVSSVEKWKRYLLQKALLKQESISEEEKTRLRKQHFS